MLDLVVLVLVIAAAIALAPYLGALLLFAAAVFAVVLAAGLIMEGIDRVTVFMGKIGRRVIPTRFQLVPPPSARVGSLGSVSHQIR